MRKAELMDIVETGLKAGRRFLVVKVEDADNLAPEIIINPLENIGAKVSYYDAAYNDDLELIRAKESGKIIRISDALMTSNFGLINWFNDRR